MVTLGTGQEDRADMMGRTLRGQPKHLCLSYDRSYYNLLGSLIGVWRVLISIRLSSLRSWFNWTLQQRNEKNSGNEIVCCLSPVEGSCPVDVGLRR